MTGERDAPEKVVFSTLLSHRSLDTFSLFCRRVFTKLMNMDVLFMGVRDSSLYRIECGLSLGVDENREKSLRCQC